MDESEIRTLIESRSEAIRMKDIDRLMSLYSPGIVYFDAVPPSSMPDLPCSGIGSCSGLTPT
jgi:ketosteroid isomerase-like protein